MITFNVEVGKHMVILNEKEARQLYTELENLFGYSAPLTMPYVPPYNPPETGKAPWPYIPTITCEATRAPLNS